jgi:hypothetical protein
MNGEKGKFGSVSHEFLVETAEKAGKWQKGLLIYEIYISYDMKRGRKKGGK